MLGKMDPYSFEKQLNCCEVRKVGDDDEKCLTTGENYMTV